MLPPMSACCGDSIAACGLCQAAARWHDCIYGGCCRETAGTLFILFMRGNPCVRAEEEARPGGFPTTLLDFASQESSKFLLLSKRSRVIIPVGNLKVDSP